MEQMILCLFRTGVLISRSMLVYLTREDILTLVSGCRCVSSAMVRLVPVRLTLCKGGVPLPPKASFPVLLQRYSHISVSYESWCNATHSCIINISLNQRQCSSGLRSAIGVYHSGWLNFQLRSFLQSLGHDEIDLETPCPIIFSFSGLRLPLRPFVIKSHRVYQLSRLCV